MKKEFFSVDNSIITITERPNTTIQLEIGDYMDQFGYAHIDLDLDTAKELSDGLVNLINEINKREL